jgi:threonylcarbamoyladenosine tRNA methylthiotransferase MtaB
MHENSLRLIDECDIVMGHIFPFSPKQGTPAARMPQVAPPVVKERARRLREASARRREAWLHGLVGTKQRVLVEREDGSGHAENFAPVRVTPSRSLGRNELGGIVAVTITSVEGDTLVGAAP